MDLKTHQPIKFDWFIMNWTVCNNGVALDKYVDEEKKACNLYPNLFS